ncbi:MAG: LysE family transporter, partial [Ferruginibacter sp.]|nr:LysE family transporter [Rhodoferax sp.]
MPSLFFAPAFTAGLLLSLSLIIALGPQNAHVLRMALTGQHVWTTIGVSIASDVALIGLGVLGLAQLGGMSRTVQTVLVCGGIVFLLVYGWQAFTRFRSGASRLSEGPTATVPM